MKAKIAVIAGDGIGPEVVAEGVRVLEQVAQTIRPRVHARRSAVRRHRHRPHRRSAAPGDARRLPRGRCRIAGRHRRTEVGAVGAGAPRAGSAAPAPRARRVRQPAAHQAAPGAARCLGAQARDSRRRGPRVRARTHRRHLLRRQDAHADSAPATCAATRASEIERITRVAGRLAMQRRKKIVSIDKSNVLETSRLWREVADARHSSANFRTWTSSTCWSIPPPCT